MNQLRLSTKYLEAAIQFAQLPLSEFQSKALETVERVVQRIIHRGEPPTEVRPGDLSLETLTLLQEHALQILRDITKRPAPSATVAGDLRLSFWAIANKDGSVRVRTMGPPLDRFLFQLIRLLGDAGVKKLLSCPAPKARPETGPCGRLFLKVTKKDYCSARCQSRAYMAKMRAVERAEREKLTQKGSRRGKQTRKK